MKSYESYLNKHIIPELGHIKRGDLKPQDIQRFLNSRSKLGLKPRTVQYLRAILRSARSQAVDWGYIERNQTTATTPPRMHRRDPTVLTADEARRLIEVTVDARLGNLFAIALLTGLRQGELLGLRWSDVDLAAGILQVRKCIQKHDRQWMLLDLKSETSRRQLHLPVTAVEILKRQQERVAAMRRDASSVCRTGTWSFPRRLGRRSMGQM